MFTFFTKDSGKIADSKNATLKKILPLRRVASAQGELTRLFRLFSSF